MDREIEGEVNAAKGSGTGTRGNTIAAKVVRENVLLLFGCRPSLGVDAETTMVRDLVKTLISRLDKETLSVTFPKVLDQMSGSDASFEMSASNTIKPMQMFYNHNIASHKYGLVIVNTTISNNGKNLPWKNAAQNGTDASNMLKVTFGFKDVVVLTDATKDQIIAAYDTMQKKVDTFEKDKKKKETALCAVFWIGHTWYGLGHHR